MEHDEQTIEDEEQVVAECLGYDEIPPMSLPDYTVSLPFREMLKEQFPGLGSSEPYWRMLGYLMFGTWRLGPGDLGVPFRGLLTLIRQPLLARRFAFPGNVGLPDRTPLRYQ